MPVPPDTPSIRLVIFRWVLSALLVALGIYGCVRIALELQQADAPWRDWLVLLMTAVPLALGVMIAMVPRRAPPFLRKRGGAARIFGSAYLGGVVISGSLIRLLNQKSLAGAMAVLAGAVIFWGLAAIVYGAINGDIEEQEKRPN